MNGLPLPNLQRELQLRYPDLVIYAELDICLANETLCQRLVFEGTLKQLLGYGLLNRKPRTFRGGRVQYYHSDFGTTGHGHAGEPARAYHFLAVDPDQDEARITKQAQREAYKIIGRLQRTARTAASKQP